MERSRGIESLDESGRELIGALESAYALKPHLHVLRPYKRFWVRRALFDLVSHPNFRFCVRVVIVLNTTLVLSVHFQKSSAEQHTWDKWITRIDVVFATGFFCEMVMKVISFTWQGYWRVIWNRLDFVLALYVFPDICTLVLQELGHFDLNLLLFIRVCSVCRAFRLLRLLTLNNGVMTILYTLCITLPSVMHIGLMLLLVLYMYSVAGVILFSQIDQDGVTFSNTRNFENTPTAAWMLFQICIGDIWPDVMHKCMDNSGDVSETPPLLAA